MKKLILFCCAVVFLNSCDKNEVTAPVSASKLVNIDKLTKTRIGKDIDGDFQFTATKASIFKTFKNLVEVDSDNRPLEPQSIRIETIDGKKYLRILSKHNYVSTIELTLDPNNNYVTEETVCSSTACASGGGCVPDGLYCTECRIGVNGGLKGDCKRTTTGGGGGTGPVVPGLDPGFTHP